MFGHTVKKTSRSRMLGKIKEFFAYIIDNILGYNLDALEVRDEEFF